MDNEGREFFEQAVRRSVCYLEYGCGGSTIFACKEANVPTVISVDSHPIWIKNVRAAIGSSSSTLLLERCDIGTVGEWGFPDNTDRIKDFWRYMVTPWEKAKRENAMPDTILIDGRFRVASFLYSLISAKDGAIVMFDDYVDRPYYSVVQDYCALEERRGRMGVFRVADSYNRSDITATIAQYSINPR
jgi:hypothetical protein